MVLYWASGSVPCWRAMITLEEKGLTDYKSHLVEMSKNEHKSEEILKINPRGLLPTFKDGDVVVNESQAICEYLENKYKSQGTKLIPDDPKEFAVVTQTKIEVLNLFRKGVEDCLFYKFRTDPKHFHEEEFRKKKDAVAGELTIWDGRLKQRGPFIAGPMFSMADIFFFPTVAFLVRLGVQLQPRWPYVSSYYGMMCQRKSVQNTWPPHWKGTAGPGILSDV